LIVSLFKKKDELNNLGEPFYKSISDATISLSKIVVRFINASEICIDYLKHLKNSFIDNEIISISKEEIDADSDECQFITTTRSSDKNNLKITESFPKSSKELNIITVQNDKNVEKNDSHQVSSLIISNLPTNVTEDELKELSNDIINVSFLTNKRNTDFK
jgi:hypothetical protein